MQYVINPDEKYFELKPKLLKYIKKAEDKFFKNIKTNEAHLVSKLINTPLVIKISDRFEKVYGTANYLGPKCDKFREMELVFTHEINTYSNRLIYEIVSHELAHIYDFLINGESNHTPVWRDIHKRMGGTGDTLIS